MLLRSFNTLAPILVVAFLGALFPQSTSAQWTNGQSAFRVVGQTGFGLSATGNSATSLNLPTSVAIDAPRGKLYVADTGNNRVLRYAWPVTSDGPAAEVVFGQPGFDVGTANNGGISASTLSTPYGICVDSSGTLHVADSFNNRVLSFLNAHLVATNGVAADRVLGKGNFTDSNAELSQTRMSSPFAIAHETAADRLWVAETGNRRVVRFENASTKTNGAAADGVLGQANFVSNSATLNAAGMNTGNGVAVHGGSLYVTNTFYNRVLRFDNAAAKANGANADGVLGQPNFTSSASATTAGGLNLPFGIATDATGRLYIADYFNSRLILHTAAGSKSNGATGDHVLGPNTFTVAGSGNGASNLSAPYGVAVDSVSGVLAIADYGNNRVVLQQASAPLPVAMSGFVVE